MIHSLLNFRIDLETNFGLLAQGGPLSRALRTVTSLDQAYFASESLAWLAALLVLAGLLMFWWSYRRSAAKPWEIAVGVTLKACGLLALIFCLLEPMNVAKRAQPGENLFVVLADNTKSLQITDEGAGQSRGDALRERLSADQAWQQQLATTFDVRRYQFDSRVQAVDQFELDYEGSRTWLYSAIADVSRRLGGRPVAGILLFTDGNSGETPPGSWQSNPLPAIYPVTVGKREPEKDLRITRVSVSETNFEAAPVTLTAEFDGVGHVGKNVVISVIDPEGKTVESQTVTLTEDTKANRVRFQLQPEGIGVMFYDVTIQTEESFRQNQEGSVRNDEATMLNNRLTAVVDRGGGPYRVLYVCGRPNWEFKFLRRAIADDLEVELVGLLRIAKREPKFSFLGRRGESSNPLFRGFDRTDEETEEYDQPVLLRVNTEDDRELRDGFPKVAEELFRYDAVILDDVDREYFTHEQLLLIKRFVSDRGGGLFMLGGAESFAEGDFQNTPIEDLLPVYLNKQQTPQSMLGYQLQLSRDGWLQPWMRLRRTEVEEGKRLREMPYFYTVNRVGRSKPGAEELAFVTDPQGKQFPALVTHSFGRGRVGAAMVGDFWRWDIRRETSEKSDLQTAWRQLVRWLVADVPQRVEVDVEENDSASAPRTGIQVNVNDELFEPMDNATVSITLQDPSGEQFTLSADPSDDQAGVYETDISARSDGSYLAKVTVLAPDGSLVGEQSVGWNSAPDFQEFASLSVNRGLLQDLAGQTGGEVIELEDLERLIGQLPNRPAPVMETIEYPLWHRSSLFLIAICCLVAEWGWRRFKGMA